MLHPRSRRHNPALRKLFRAGKPAQFKIIEKDVIDEIIFRTSNPRNRLIFELMACACMRVDEVLTLTPKDIEDRQAVIRDPKSGKEAEVASPPQKVADRLQKYIRDNGIEPGDRIFYIIYAAARIIVKKAGGLVGIHPWPRPAIPISDNNALKITRFNVIAVTFNLKPFQVHTI